MIAHLGPQFDPDEFVEKYENAGRVDEAWFDDVTANGRCHAASEDVVAFARKQGLSAGLVERHDHRGNFEHVASRVGNFVIDMTSAQLPHTHGAYGETVRFDPKVHKPTDGWYGRIPRVGAPRVLGHPVWPHPDEYDHPTLTRPVPWIKWR